MMADPYNAATRALFANPVHAGDLDGAIRAARDEQGVRIELSALAENGAINALRFRAWGCPHVIAAAESLCAGYEGRKVSDLLQVSAADFMQSLAVPVEKTGRILVIEDVARALGAALHESSKLKNEQD